MFDTLRFLKLFMRTLDSVLCLDGCHAHVLPSANQYVRETEFIFNNLDTFSSNSVHPATYLTELNLNVCVMCFHGETPQFSHPEERGLRPRAGRGAGRV